MNREEQEKEEVQWILQQFNRDVANEKQYLDYKERFPYEVVLVDQFQGHCEYGYDKVARYATLEEAVAVAKKITEDALLRFGSVASWHGMGDAGLVYDLKGTLVWDGVREYTNSSGSAEVFKALEFAVRAHSGQLRKGANIPYIMHPLGAARNLMEADCPNKIVIASLLHDVIEETAVTYSEIEEQFGRYVAELVKHATEPDKSAPWKERKAHTIKTLQKAGLDAALVACADKLDNIRAIKNDYAKLGEKFWERFNASKEDQAWYYRSLAEAFSAQAKDSKYAPLFNEFIGEVKGDGSIFPVP